MIKASRFAVVLGKAVTNRSQRWLATTTVRADEFADIEALKRSQGAVSFLHKDLRIIRAKPDQLRPKLGPKNPMKFGQNFSDYMVEVDWTVENGWEKPVLCPLHDLKLHPASKVLHYATEVFEGMKAYRGVDGKIRLFRPEKNMERLRRSARRAVLPDFSSEELIKIIKALVRLEKDWIPSQDGCGLYIRPAIVGTDEHLGVAMSHRAKLFILTGPSGPYFSSSVALFADPNFTRSFPGGVGSYKMGCNYAPSIIISTQAQLKGCHQALWLYGPEEYITEVGATNIFFTWKNDSGEVELITPPLDGGLILPGITRDSILTLAREWKSDVKVTEKFVGMQQFRQAVKENRVYEMFCCGTACLISPVNKILYKNNHTGKLEELLIPNDPDRGVMKRLYKQLTDIQYGRVERPDWTEIVC